MRFGIQTDWDSKHETIDEWLKRERVALKTVENPTCPYCGHVHTEWWEYSKLNDSWEIEDYEIQCCSCEKDFLVNKDTQVRFESKPQIGDE